MTSPSNSGRTKVYETLEKEQCLIDTFNYTQVYNGSSVYLKKDPVMKFFVRHDVGGMSSVLDLPTRFYVDEDDAVRFVGFNNKVNINNNNNNVSKTHHPCLKDNVSLNYIGLPRLLLKNSNNSDIIMSELLGLFENQWVETVKVVFKRFMDVMMYVSNNLMEVITFLTSLNVGFDINDFKIECDVTNGVEVQCDIVRITLFFRVLTITHMYEGVKNNITKYNLALWLSTHVDLSLELDSNHDHKPWNEIFFNPDSSPHLYPPFIRTYPHDARFLTAGELPDTTNCLYKSTMKPVSDSSKSKDRSFMGIVTYLIFVKTRPYTCQKRVISRMIPEEIEKSDELKKFFLKVIEISLNGDYQWSNARLSFRNRCFLRMKIRSGKLNVSDMVRDHEYLLIFILREYVLYIMTLSPSYGEFVANEEYKEFIVQSMDLVRYKFEQLLSQELFFGDNVFKEQVQFLEQKIHPIFLTFGTKTDKHPPAIVFHKKMESVFRSFKLFDKPEVYVTMKQRARVLTLIHHVQSLGHIHMKCYLDVEYIKLLNLNPELYFYFKFILREYRETEAADNPIDKKFKFMLNSHYQDTCVLRYYLYMMSQTYNRLRFVLPRSLTSLQQFGFEKKMCFHNTTPQIKKSYFCDNCGSWANYIMRQGDKKSRKNMACYTPHECAQRLDNDMIVCLKAKSRNRNVSSEENRIKKAKCLMDNLNDVDMIGVIQKIGNKLFMKCWICDCLFELRSSGCYGFTCNNHVHDDEVKGIGLYTKPQSNLPFYPCFYCNNNIYSKGHNMKTIGAKITVIDDTDREPLVKGLRKHSIRQIGLCNMHYAYFLEIQKQSVIPLLSVILGKLLHKTNIKIRRMSSTRG